jgi:hypothetical protein
MWKEKCGGFGSRLGTTRAPLSGQRRPVGSRHAELYTISNGETFVSLPDTTPRPW